MKFAELLPVGSVVLLKEAQKKLVIMGIMQTKRLPDGQIRIYDYLGVPYPQGYVGSASGMLFNHEKIQEIFFTGYTDQEREIFTAAIQKAVDQSETSVLG